MRSNFDNLIKQDKYQVLLFRCKAHFPFNFADHIWFVVNQKGTLSRWEVLYKKGISSHVNKNAYPPFQGINIFNFSKKYFWKSELLHMIEGEENSPAKKMADFIENSASDYPYGATYSLLGPNCGTYVQWILTHFPEFDFQLKNYIGKNYSK